MRPYDHRLQLVPQQALSEVPGGGVAAMAGHREAELLPVPYFHVVYTLPSKLRDIAYQNKRVVYDLLMKAAAETTLAIAADPRRLGARIGVTAVLHTWGSTLTHHPHVHMIVPGGGLSPDGARWVACRSNFLVHINLLARLFSGKMLAMLADAHDAGQLTFFNAHAGLADKTAFKRFIAPLRRIKCRVGGDVAIPTPHRPGLAGFPHPVLHGRVSLAAAYPWRILTGGSGCRASSSLKRVHRTTP